MYEVQFKVKLPMNIGLFTQLAGIGLYGLFSLLILSAVIKVVFNNNTLILFSEVFVMVDMLFVGLSDVKHITIFSGLLTENTTLLLCSPGYVMLDVKKDRG